MVSGYIKDVWFDKNTINNTFSLKKMINKYRVTCDSLDQMIIVHWKKKKTNMHFIMHESGFHFYDPAEYLTFVTTVSDNKKHYREQQIKAE